MRLSFHRLLLALLLFSDTALWAQHGAGQVQIHQDPDSAIAIGEVKISAYRLNNTVRSSPGSISVLTSNDLSVATDQGMTILNTIPGISMQSGTLTTSRIVIRGMGSRTPYNTNRIKAYLNNIPLTTADGIFAPDETDITSLARIEIIKGPSSALYGSGLGGSINMYTPDESQNNLKTNVQYGSFNTLNSNISGTFTKNKTIIWGNLSYLASSGYRENNQYRRTSGISTIRWEHPGWSLKSTIMLTGVNAGIPSSLGKTSFETAPRSAAPNWLAIKGYKEYLKGIAALSFNHNLSGNISGEAILFGKWNDDFERRPFNDLDDRSSGGGFRYEMLMHFENIRLVSGTEIFKEKYSWMLEKNGTLLNNNSETRNQYSFFSMLEYKITQRLNISAGGALNLISYYLEDRFPADGDQSGKRRFSPVLSPRLGANFALSSYLALYASAGHGFSMPSVEETLLPEGIVNNNIKPETGFQYEAGVRFDNKGRLEADASLYLIDLRNLLVTKRVSEDIFTGINAGRTHHYGIELSLKAVLTDMTAFPGKLSSVLGYTLSKNRFVDFTDNEVKYDGKYLPGIPGQILRLQFNWQMFSYLSFKPGLQYTGSQYLTDDNTLSYHGYLLASSRISGDFKIKNAGITAFLEMNNLTGTRYASMLVVNALPAANGEPRYYYPGMPRNFNFGISFSFL